MFSIRVELHNAGLFDYNTLHAAMVASGFMRSVKADNGQSYHLPPAEYVVTGNYTVDQVLHAAKTAANKTGKTSSIIVFTVSSWRGDNLVLVR